MHVFVLIYYISFICVLAEAKDYNYKQQMDLTQSDTAVVIMLVVVVRLVVMLAVVRLVVIMLVVLVSLVDAVRLDVLLAAVVEEVVVGVVVVWVVVVIVVETIVDGSALHKRYKQHDGPVTAPTLSKKGTVLPDVTPLHVIAPKLHVSAPAAIGRKAMITFIMLYQIFSEG